MRGLWAARRRYRDDPHREQLIAKVLDELFAEFGWKARLAAPIFGRYFYRMLRREEQRLQNGWTYEPPTCYETNSADGPAGAVRVVGVTAHAPPNSQPTPLDVQRDSVRGNRRRKLICTSRRASFRGKLQLHLVDKGGVVAPLRVHADKLDGVHPGRHGETRRLVCAITGAGGDDRTDFRTVEEYLDLLRILLAGALRGLQRDAVGAGVRVYGLAHAASFWMKATWLPSGAVGLPEVKPLPLLLTPVPPPNCQDEPLGEYW